MSEPEIDRRCTICGAAVRQRAAFCPQCGQPIDLEAKSPERDVVDNSLTVEIPRSALPDLSETQPIILRQDAAELARTQPLSNVQIPASARPAEGNVKAKVEKLRRASSVVIDQAAYDPSLRFVLIGALLFIVFLVLLLFSEVLG